MNYHIRLLKSYAPYSLIEESCYVRGKTGLFYPGVRVENVSFPLIISAVQAAVCSCLANGDQPGILYQNHPKSELLEFWLDEFDMELYTELPNQIEPFNPVLASISDITQTLDELCSFAITPHSGFPVSAILQTESGFIAGVNVEVSAWSLGLCAERVALSRAYSSGITKFIGMHVYAPKSEFCSPCGACRQVMYELMPDKIVELHHSKNALSKHFVKHLLPYGITTDFLKKKQNV